MGRFRKKSVEIEAIRWLGPYVEGGHPFADEGARYRFSDGCVEVWNDLEYDWINVPHGHWIIKGIQGEFYPCDPDVFEATYDKA